MLRPSTRSRLLPFWSDPQASENDECVALQFLRNFRNCRQRRAATCQDTGTAIVVGKGQHVLDRRRR
ncbi:fumarate hydratase [Shigella flexneri]